MHPAECSGLVPTWNRIPDRPGTSFTIGSSRLNFGDIVTLTVYHSASISTPCRSSVVQNRTPSIYKCPTSPAPPKEGLAVSRISFSIIKMFII